MTNDQIPMTNVDRQNPCLPALGIFGHWPLVIGF
jgi:hypothetical protein